MRKHGWQLPYHPLQVVAIAVFLALGFAFYVFFLPFVGKKLFEYVVLGLYTPLAWNLADHHSGATNLADIARILHNVIVECRRCWECQELIGTLVVGFGDVLIIQMGVASLFGVILQNDLVKE